MEKKNLNIQWTQIIVTAVITGLVSLIVAILVFNYTNDSTELYYEEFPVSAFENNSTQIGILNYSIRNTGRKTAADVLFLVSLPENATIKEPNISTSSLLVQSQIHQVASNKIIFEVASLHQYESFNISLLAENIDNNSGIKVELKSVDSLGTKFEQKDDSLSPTAIYIIVTIIILAIILFAVLIFGVGKAIKLFKNLNQQLDRENEIEQRKVHDIMSQGVEYCDMGLCEDSIRVLRKGIYLHPEASGLHSNLARAYARTGKFKEAESEFRVAEKLIDGETDQMIFYYTKAHFYALSNNPDKVIEYLKLAMKIDRDRVREKMLLDEEFIDLRTAYEFTSLQEIN